MTTMYLQVPSSQVFADKTHHLPKPTAHLSYTNRERESHLLMAQAHGPDNTDNHAATHSSHFYQNDLLNKYHDPYYSTDSSSSSSSSSSTSNSPAFQPQQPFSASTPYHKRTTTSTRYHPYMRKHPTKPTTLHPAISPATSDSSLDEPTPILSSFALFGSLPSHPNNNHTADNEDLGDIMDDDDIFADFADMSSSSDPILQSPPPSPSPQHQDLADVDDFLLF